MVYVKTVYTKESFRLPNISAYRTEKEASSFRRICLKHGIGIVSCEIVSESEARRLLKDGLAEE